MTYPGDTLDAIRIVEGQKRNIIVRLFSPVTVESTAKYSVDKFVAPNVEQVSFKAALFYPIMLLSFFLLPIFISYIFAFHTDRGFEAAMLFPLVLAILMFCLAAYIYFFRKSFVYRLCVGVNGIKIDREQYDWREIAETAIIKKGSGKTHTTYLGILLRDGTYRRVDINLFWTLGFSKKLARLIEYYKGCYKQNTHKVLF